MANKAIKYRLYPTTEQATMFAKTFGCCRKVYFTKRKRSRNCSGPKKYYFLLISTFTADITVSSTGM